ncbi:MAG: J domain-containing protein [Pseudolabrys sp.]
MYAAPLPPDILDVIRIAAESPEACQEATLATGRPGPELVDAARFYLQQVLFREDADAYRILGIKAGDSRASARAHMRWLLRWLHPDRNGGWDAVYAKRIVQAWREVSNDSVTPRVSHPVADAGKINTRRNGVRHRNSVRLPWIAQPYVEKAEISRRHRTSTLSARAMAKVAAAIVAVLLLLGLSAPASTLRFISALW